MTRTRMRIAARLLAAALITIPTTLGVSGLSSAAPSREDVQRARARLNTLNAELSVLVEEYNLARFRLQQVQERLEQVQADAERARARADRAMASLNASAARAYRGVGSQFATLFDATSLSDFSDRLEFIGSLARADADLAAEAELARQEAQWTADELRATLEERRAVLAEIRADQTRIRAKVAEARELFEQLNREYEEALAARAAAEAAAQEQAQEQQSVGPGPPPIPPPPAPNPNVQSVLDAAYSALGTPYQWGGASPETGFDCSGFTMWAWSFAGVSLPHSSTLQYQSTPRIDRANLQPGDLVFSSYGRLGSGVVDHVGIYVGGGRMIASSNTGEVVSVKPIDWDNYVGAGRPG